MDNEINNEKSIECELCSTEDKSGIVVLPRSEYDSLLRKSTLLDVCLRAYDADSYCFGRIYETIFRKKEGTDE